MDIVANLGGNHLIAYVAMTTNYLSIYLQATVPAYWRSKYGGFIVEEEFVEKEESAEKGKKRGIVLESRQGVM